ncbi:MAG: NUDIX hydrolase [Proteobacteria bacterium]|nr:NUDIX hydrolase [Pseudomonadota bacterium]NBX86620.1 NUDIX hydrolase [Pseudomonadota bacterium]
MNTPQNTPSRAKRRHKNAHKHTKRPPKGSQTKNNPRHFYDVRLYALLTDSESNLLILQLPKEYDESAANTWTLPGGKLEPTDEPAHGLLREIREETGLEATISGLCGLARWSTRNSKKLAIFYKAQVSGQKPTLKLSGEHQRAIWINPQEADQFPFHRPDMLTIIKEKN